MLLIIVTTPERCHVQLGQSVREQLRQQGPRMMLEHELGASTLLLSFSPSCRRRGSTEYFSVDSTFGLLKWR